MTSYLAIAKAMGLKFGACMVARAMANNKNVKPAVSAQDHCHGAVNGPVK